MRIVLICTALAFACAGCPEKREKVINDVGGAAKNEIDTTKARLKQSEDKFAKQAKEAAAATE